MNIMKNILKRNLGSAFTLNALFYLTIIWGGIVAITLVSTIFLNDIVKIEKVEDMYYTQMLPITAFIVAIFLAYFTFVVSQNAVNYQNHKVYGSYVPSRNFDEEIRKIELNKGHSLERYAVPYTTNIKYARRLIKDMIKEGYIPNTEYDYKEDSYKYSVSKDDILISGRTASEEMAICIMYVELFEK
ncbi:hypothetical protein [Psychrobacillus sp. FSL H8-0487]|uniref:hypothetical protein n=1 Tax=Psychrobacillus sp. FSL H8-0487 TaxID=2921391 RepID=UPI0030F7B6C2